MVCIHNTSFSRGPYITSKLDKEDDELAISNTLHITKIIKFTYVNENSQMTDNYLKKKLSSIIIKKNKQEV